MKKILFIVISFVLLCGCSTQKQSDNNKKDVTVVLDWTPNTNHTGLYVALENGYYEEAGLNVSIIQPPEDGAIALVCSKKAQFGVSFQESMAFALPSIPVTAVASIIDHNTSGIISKKEKNISSFKELEGKKYATWGTPFEKSAISYAMEIEGGDINKVDFIPSTVTDAISAINTDVDAVWVFEGWDVVAAELNNVDYNFIRFKDVSSVLDFYTPILIANNDFLENEPELTRKFLEATKKGYEFTIENPDKATEILIKAAPELSYDLVEKSHEFLSKQYKSDKAEWGTIDEKRWKDFYDFMYNEGLITEEIGSKGFTNEFLK